MNITLYLGANKGNDPALKQAYCKPEEVADQALFLASEKSSPITGSLVTMDGGQAALGR